MIPLLIRKKNIFIKTVVKNLIPRRYLLYKGKIQNGSITLTFDDGPHPLYRHSPLVHWSVAHGHIYVKPNWAFWGSW